MSFNETDVGSSTNNSYILNGEINGPVYAAALSVELVLAFIPNLFIIVYTLCHPKILRQPSMIFLTGLAVINLLSVVLYIPFAVITAAAGEWIFGQTDKQKDGVCQLTGFILTYMAGASIHMLAIISFDRFLLIVKPFVYQRFMKPWLAFVSLIALNVYVVLQDIAPFFGLGEYGFEPVFASCIPAWTGHMDYVIFFSIFRMIPIIIIVVTSLWTFCFTRKFIQKERNQKMAVSKLKSSQQYEINIYTKRIRNLFGIFGSLLIVTIVSLSPYIIVSVVGFSIGFENIPVPLLPTVLVLFFVNNIANPIVQIYFRRDLKNALLEFFKRMKRLFQFRDAGTKDSKSGESKQDTASTVHYHAAVESVSGVV